MGLLLTIQRIEERRKRLREIKEELILTKQYMSSAILECNDADEMIKAITKISLAIIEIDELISQVL